MKLHKLTIVALVGCVVACAQAMAGTIAIQLTGVNLNYSDPDGGGAGTGSLTDAGAPADPLSSLLFTDDGSPVGILSSPPDSLTLDLSVLGVPSIAVPGPNSSTSVSAPAGGSLTVAVNAGTMLDLDLDSVGVVYSRINFSSFDVRVLFAATVGSIVSQSLPFSLQIGNPVTASFTLQGTSTVSGGFLTKFVGAGTGVLSGAIPEPSTIAMLAAMGALMVFVRTRH